MISSIKTPGVYINEINAFPPSVAQVATAIPAFIGFTEKGPAAPTKIRSMLDFEQLFGGAPAPKKVEIDLSTEEFKVEESIFKLYGSLRLFFTNGGGSCYIVSIGKYEDTATITDKTAFEAGIALLEPFDEPTLILFPDAINLDAPSLGGVHQAALSQCQTLMDRFTIMDVKQDATTDLEADMLAFRNGTGSRALKYGAGYYPYLKASFGFNFRFMDIHSNDGSTGVNFKTLQPDLLDNIKEFEDMHADAETLEAAWDGKNTEKEKPTDLPINTLTKTNSYATKCWELLKTLGDPTALANADFETEIVGLVKTGLMPLAQKLVNFEAKVKDIHTTYVTVFDTVDNNFDDTIWKNGDTDFAANPSNPFDGQLSNDGGTTILYPVVEIQLNKMHTQIINSITGILDAGEDFLLKQENDLTPQLKDWPAIVKGLSQTMNTLPPSGAVAGIYANTDATRGVWKAPANVGINGIVDLTDDITHKEQETMNIHETGKSVNAIRKFTGKGMLVWGARTLDGNSNDWRYINVRRLANMMEESAKKASMAFVFEPNVKQTWVNIKGMLENYLTTLWADGALAGAKPADAFFVNVGLGSTMTATDINEGKLIVQIGYAPSRPAEFIILEFTQTQQRS